MVLRLEPMTPATYDVWRGDAVRVYAQEFVDSGILEAEGAAERARKDFDELLPEGLATPNHLLWSAHVEGEDESVGAIWVKLTVEPAPTRAYVYALDVHPPYRRRGYGQAIMEAAIETCRQREVVSIGLNVFGHNDVARRMYDRLGFVVVATNMKLDL